MIVAQPLTSLRLPATKETLTDFFQIQKFLKERGVALSRWRASLELNDDDTQEKILEAYAHELRPFMDANGFLSADVINVHPGTENLLAIRDKFLKEHTHSEDEVRFFVEGQGQFWFHFDGGEVVGLTCVRGDFLAVPQGYKHWFDLAPGYRVKAIRIFTNKEGWVANYTNSGVEAAYVASSTI